MAITGAVLVAEALRELGIADPIDPLSGEDQQYALRMANRVLDAWRAQSLTISGITRSVYSLSASTQSYTIGSGGTFDQDWPEEIVSWSIIPDDSADDPREIEMGRPYTADEWQSIDVKSLEGSRPTAMWYDRNFVTSGASAGLGQLHFWPIPDGSTVDVVLYQRIPDISSIVAATSYTFRPAFEMALILALAVRLAPSYEVPAQRIPDLHQQAREALAVLKRSNIVAKEAPIRDAFVIGQTAGRRQFNVYTGTSR